MCFRCFIGTLQLFHADVAKVDRDVALSQWLYTYVAKVCFQCFICVFGCIFASVFYLNVVYVSDICYKCFIWILRMFCNGFQVFSRYFFVSVS
jgi:hypothetical protein